MRRFPSAQWRVQRKPSTFDRPTTSLSSEDGDGDDGSDSEEDDDEFDSDEVELEEADDEESSAHATPGVVATAPPTPSATAKAPTRPMYLAYGVVTVRLDFAR